MAISLWKFIKGIILKGESSDISDNIEGSFWHNSTTHRFKGYLDSAVREVITADQVQTLTNKTIDGDSNTVQDLPLTAIKTDAGNASKFIERDASGIPVNGKAVPTGDVIGSSDTQTLTNKTIDVDNNTISNIEVDNLKAGVVDTDLSSVSASDDTLASAKAIKTYVDDAVATKDAADEISYDNSTSGLTATDVQAAIDEVEGRVDTDETNLSNHISDTSTHGITSNILGESETQTVTNKTIDGA
jgi:hypothetical protein